MVTPTRSNRRVRTALVATLSGILAWPMVASAQLDPLLMLKRTKPNVLLVVDTRNAMLRDADHDYYDAYTYPKTGELWEGTPGLSVTKTAKQYRRKYIALAHIDKSLNPDDNFTASAIVAIGDLDPAFSTFWARTRLGVARLGVAQAVQDNQSVARFGLLKMRQSTPQWGTEKNEGPVLLDLMNVTQQAPTEMGKDFKWNITRPTVGGVNGLITSVQPPLVAADAASANSSVLTLLHKEVGVAGALTAGGRDSRGIVDAPVEFMLDDAKAEASRLISADAECRNTIVVLVVGGGEGHTVSGADPVTKASKFLTVGNRRVPIYVIAIAPPAGDVAQLQAIATKSGGQYVEITKAMIEAAPAGLPVPEVTRAVNVAVQHAFAEFADFNPAAQNPVTPTTSEFQVTSPVVGTVNLKNSTYLDGTTILDGDITNPFSGAVIPQRSNVLVTTGFTVPGFGGALHALRVYKPVVDLTKLSSYKFVSDGRRLWDAAAPAAASRNIYTVTPNGTMTALTSANAPVLAPYMNTTTAEAARIIEYVRTLPLGAFVGSTPAIMDAPSIDPAPDPEYPGFAAANKGRRTLIWIGGNDGMMHAIDGRLGLEVWAFVPFNLLPKLRTLLDGQAVGNFEYLVDSSAKVADVRVSAPCSEAGVTTCWRTYLFFGEGPGGTFYQAFDVTMADMATVVSQDDNTITTLLSYFADPGRITFKWAFPTYQDFDYTLAPYGDIKATAPNLSKTVGETWSDPAVGEIQHQNGAYAVLTGSGFFSYSKQTAANRGGIIAGSTFYLLNVETGEVYDSRDVGNDGNAEHVDNCAVANPTHCEAIKNALQADPVATGPPDSRYITKAYIGDLDGRVWRFDLALVNGLPKITAAPATLYDAGANQPMFASMATVNVGTRQYLFFATGSDLLPTDNLGVLKAPFKLLGILDQGASGTKTFDFTLVRLLNRTSEEKATAFPAVAGDIVFFTTTTFHPATPCILPDANLYALTFIGGPAYDNTGDNRITSADTTKVKTVTGARATASFISDQHVVFGAGGKVELFGDKEDYNNGVGQVGVRILSWREMR